MIDAKELFCRFIGIVDIINQTTRKSKNKGQDWLVPRTSSLSSDQKTCVMNPRKIVKTDGKERSSLIS